MAEYKSDCVVKEHCISHGLARSVGAFAIHKLNQFSVLQSRIGDSIKLVPTSSEWKTIREIENTIRFDIDFGLGNEYPLLIQYSIGMETQGMQGSLSTQVFDLSTKKVVEGSRVKNGGL